MRTSFIAAVLGAVSFATVSAAPVESQKAEALALAKRLVAKNRAGIPQSRRRNKRNNTGGSSSGVTDADILNFALQLEYLEAQFYHIAAYGTQLSQDILGGTGNRGYIQNNAGQQVPFQSDLVRQYAVGLAKDEENHVRLLRTALGDAAVAQPEINFDTSFTAAAQAAGVVGSNATFSPFADDASFLLGAFIFEDVGVTAYNGAAPLISSKDYLAAAASILATEAYHAGAIRANLLAAGQQTPADIDAANKIAAARGQLDNGKDIGITTNGTATVADVDENSLAFARTPGEVLDIVYLTGTAGATSGGFFPNGLNGNLVAGGAAGAGN